LFGIGWDAVILDESTKIRNPTARITKQLTRKLDHVRLRAILTGLPAPEGVMDYYSQMQFLNGTFLGFKEFWPFRERLFLQIGYDWSPKKGVADRIRAEIREHAYILKRKDVNIGSTIVSEVRRVEMTPEQKRLYKELMKKFRVEINGVEYTTKYAIVKQAWAQRIAGGFAPPNPDGTPGVMLSDRKIKEIFYLMETELKDEPLIIWFKFNQELMAMAAALKKAKIDYHTITGATPGPDREKKRRRFQNGKVDIILVQGKVGQMGMDLSRADTEIYYSNWWDYEIRAQSRDRVIHPTKTRPCLAIDLVCQDTVDEDAVAVLNDKAVDAKMFLARLNERLMAHFKGVPRG
jgi:SNF2 family DNA or RNA helicase